LKTNQPVETSAVEGGISAGTMFDKAKSNQLTEQMEIFTHAMYGISVGPAVALAKIFDFSSYNKLMDVGGGSECILNTSCKGKSKDVCSYIGIRASL